MNENEKSPKERQHTEEEKARLLRLHLLEGRAISTICDEHGTPEFDSTSRSREGWQIFL